MRSELSSWQTSNIGDERYRSRYVFGYSSFDKFEVFKIWKPQVWNHFCFRQDNNQYNISLNNDIIINGFTEPIFKNISKLIFYERPPNKPFFGALTDVQVWRRVITNQEIQDYNHCKYKSHGDVHSWNPYLFREGFNLIFKRWLNWLLTKAH